MFFGTFGKSECLSDYCDVSVSTQVQLLGNMFFGYYATTVVNLDDDEADDDDEQAERLTV